jgi:hypothetical protein
VRLDDQTTKECHDGEWGLSPATHFLLMLDSRPNIIHPLISRSPLSHFSRGPHEPIYRLRLVCLFDGSGKLLFNLSLTIKITCPSLLSPVKPSKCSSCPFQTIKQCQRFDESQARPARRSQLTHRLLLPRINPISSSFHDFWFIVSLRSDSSINISIGLWFGTTPASRRLDIWHWLILDSEWMLCEVDWDFVRKKRLPRPQSNDGPSPSGIGFNKRIYIRTVILSFFEKEKLKELFSEAWSLKNHQQTF